MVINTRVKPAKAAATGKEFTIFEMGMSTRDHGFITFQAAMVNTPLHKEESILATS
jgi:hypothetical protein